MKPLEHDRKYGELDQVICAYLGQAADDTADERSVALDSYLRQTWPTRPWAIATAEQQLREYAQHPPGRLRLRLGEFYPVPDIGLAEAQIQGWLLLVADHLKKSVEEGDVPPPGTPQTRWEWHARFPELGQLLGGWFSQDMPDEFDGHAAALADYRGTTHPSVVTELVGELHELLALLNDADEADYALAVAELGMEVEPPAPYAMSGWLALIADRLTGFRAQYRPPSAPQQD
ncbi:contact-dependent growth inhibition system immunity protein [Streptomyces sp. H27-D2]|uniref:contact-dependent growth inhibition system immunity protein n=1 Tax=Streptomyces sp. H27-D2 TaxID=3046304 RepID=UPI002DB920B5|nr:contact-dependent growth inhibition system immunity protein [Streptomyces sp. H27-D2]MEC4020543.1 contact-dependent growth inhibition system immunity protein [Streptomyces sp. H27-D2]